MPKIRLQKLYHIARVFYDRKTKKPKNIDFVCDVTASNIDIVGGQEVIPRYEAKRKFAKKYPNETAAIMDAKRISRHYYDGEKGKELHIALFAVPHNMPAKKILKNGWVRMLGKSFQ